MKKKLAEIALVLCAAAFLLTAGVLTVVREKSSYSYYENRALQRFPAPTWEGMLTGKSFSQFETFLSDQAVGRNQIMLAKTKLDLDVFRRPLVNDVLIADEALLPYLPPDTYDEASLAQQAAQIADNLAQVKDLVEGYGGQYYYVTVPCQYVFFGDSYPWGLNGRTDYTPASMAALTEALAQRNVPLVDMGPEFLSMEDKQGLTSLTDNHYGMYGAYLTYRRILETANADGNLGLSILDETTAQTQTLPNPYMGSRNRKLFNLWPSDERMEIMTPVEAVPYTRTDNGKKLDEPWVYQLPQTETADLLYSLYMGGDVANTVLDTNRPDLPTVLIYGDSFTNPVECLLYPSFNQVHALDLRHYTEQSLGDYIRQLQPDLVVCIRDYQAIFLTEANGAAPDGPA